MWLTFSSEEELVSFVKRASLPEWQTKLFKRNAEAVQVHANGQVFYKLDSLFPNEQAESKQHRLLSFESVTEPSFGRAANNVNRIFKNSSYTVNASEKTLQIAAQDVEPGENLYTWFLDRWTHWALKEDPNSRIVVYPPEYVNRGNKQVVFVSSEHLKHVDEDVVIFISEEESETKYEIEEIKVSKRYFFDDSINKYNVEHTTEENTWTPKVVATIKRPVYHCFFKGVGFYRIEQSKDDPKKYEIELIKWKQDFIPITDAGGERGKMSVNKSFLHPFVKFGNLALLQHSQHTAVNFTFSFPRMSEIETPCDQPGCIGGEIRCDISEQYPDGVKRCSKCRGTGARQSPYKIYKKRYDPAGMEGDNKHLEVPDVQFYTPEVSILDYSKNEWKDYLEMAETAVYIQQRVKTGNVEAAKSKEIDREDLYSFLNMVGKSYFSKLRFVLQAIENFNVANPVRVNVNVPTSFAIISEGEAFEELKDILSSNVPLMFKAERVESFVNKFVSQDSPIKKFVDVLKVVDLLLYYTPGEIAGFRANNVITPEQYAIHVFSFPVLHNLYFQDKSIFNLDTNAIVEKLKTALEQYRPAPEDLKSKFIDQD